jgi:hypothetical protein
MLLFQILLRHFIAAAMACSASHFCSGSWLLYILYRILPASSITKG